MPRSLSRSGVSSGSLTAVTVVGNLAVDRVNGGPPSAGGCPAFVGAVLTKPSAGARIITQRAPRDAAVFQETLDVIGVPTVVLDCETTSAFELVYSGEQRTMTVTGLGVPWTPAQLERPSIDSAWVHVAPLLRSDFPVATVAALASGGRCVSFDGQGLVRAARLGPMVTDSSLTTRCSST